MEAQKQTQNLLDQQQRLALQDKKLLDEYKSEINDLKALKMPTQDTKVEQVSRLKNSSGAIVLNLEEQRFIKNRLTKNRPNNDQKSTKKNRLKIDQKKIKRNIYK